MSEIRDYYNGLTEMKKKHAKDWYESEFDIHPNHRKEFSYVLVVAGLAAIGMITVIVCIWFVLKWLVG